MTASDHRKVLKQLKSKPVKLKKFLRNNKPKARSCGKNLYHCRRCLTVRGLIRKYGLNLCRKCFRELAPHVGFKKYS